MFNKVLIVLNAQRDFVLGSMAVPDAETAIDTIARSLGKFDSVIYVQDWHHRLHCSFREQGGNKPAHCVANATGSQIINMLPMQLGNMRIVVVRKGAHRYVDGYSAFWERGQEYETDLRNKLRRLTHHERRLKLFVCGFVTEECVLNTVKDAVRNYDDVTVLDDACRGRNPEASERALEEMAECGAMILPSTSVVASAPIAVPVS